MSKLASSRIARNRSRLFQCIKFHFTFKAAIQELVLGISEVLVRTQNISRA